MHNMQCMGIHDLWFLPLVVRQVGYSIHVLILILFQLEVEHEGLELFSFCLLMVYLVLQNVWLRQC